MKTSLANNRGMSLVVVLMVMAILITVIGAGLMFSGINTKVAMHYRTGNRAFNAADTGMLAIALSVTPGTIPSSTPVSLGSNLCFRFGTRNGTLPSMTPTLKTDGGYTLGSGTSNYNNNSGYAFYQYQVNVTGTYSLASGCPSVGSESAAREVEALALYGPVAQ